MSSLKKLTIHELIEILPQVGEVVWIGTRPARDQPMQTPTLIQAEAGRGLEGDRFRAKRTTREVTLIQAEHIDAVASMLGRASLDPAILRRNIVVRGINLLALKNTHFRVGDVTLEFTGLAHPCSRMESALGPGGYNAMRGHGGITTRIIGSGQIKVGDPVCRLDTAPS